MGRRPSVTKKGGTMDGGRWLRRVSCPLASTGTVSTVIVVRRRKDGVPTILCSGSPPSGRADLWGTQQETESFWKWEGWGGFIGQWWSYLLFIYSIRSSVNKDDNTLGRSVHFSQPPKIRGWRVVFSIKGGVRHAEFNVEIFRYRNSVPWNQRYIEYGFTWFISDVFGGNVVLIIT